ncbi:MAG TPA: DNA translocase FtsK 4TM domain-containing protein, partial [Acidimicrobiales bacterium]
GSTALRGTLDPHRDDLIGLVVIVAGVLLGLAVYLRLAGPVGGGIDTALGALVGVGRYVLPVALVGCGVALLLDGRSEHRFRLVFGVGLATVALLGLLHIARGPHEVATSPSAVDDAGGWVGAAVGEPARRLVAPAGAVVLSVALLVAGLLIATRGSLRRMAVSMGRGIKTGAVPALRKAKRAVVDMSTLSSERGGGVIDATAAEAGGADGVPALYDHASEDPPSGAGLGRKRGRRALPPPEPGSLVVGYGQQLEIDLGPGAQKGQWKLPPASYLTRTSAQEVDRSEVQARGRVLEESLASHGVETRLVGMTVGPTVTRYELELGSGVKVARVTTLQRDIAYAMAATDVRILAPIPGRSAIGIEVPNHTRHLVSLGDILGSTEARQATHPLDVAIGKDIAGRAVFLNLATTPHLLIAGATGAGKSSGLNCIITSLLMRTTPEQVRLILVDPKQVEMGQYNRLPHLLTQPVTNPKKAANALSWAVKEMERRYDVLYEVGFRDITGYNAAYDRGELNPPTVGVAAPPAGADVGLVFGVDADDPPDGSAAAAVERLPYIVVVVDELNDLMMVAARDVEESITRIAQKARAVGIHLIVATQRPSVNVITGVIKANIPARVAFAVSSLTDSRVILDQPGAEKLVGRGDMLLLPGNSNVAQRIQGSFVSEEEVRKVVAHWRRQAPEVLYVSGVEGDEHQGGGGFGDASGDDEDEVLLRQAMDLVVRSQLGSTSMLQRKLKVGFARAGRLMDLLEQRGVVGPSEGSKARAVLMTVEELDLLLEAERSLDS